MTPQEKALRMLERWKGDKVKCVALAKENIKWHLDSNPTAVKFWRDVIAELEKHDCP